MNSRCSRFEALRDAWVITGHRNPIPELLRQIDRALPLYASDESRINALMHLIDLLEGRRDTLLGDTTPAAAMHQLVTQ